MASAVLIVMLISSVIVSTKGCGTLHQPTIVKVSGLSDEFITSPNYPGRYANNLNCVWKVEAAKGKYVGYNFAPYFRTEFDLDKDTCDDAVSLWNPEESRETVICGSFHQGPPKGMMSSSVMYVFFTTDDNNVLHTTSNGSELIYSGFKMAVAAGFKPERPDSDLGSDFVSEEGDGKIYDVPVKDRDLKKGGIFSKEGMESPLTWIIVGAVVGGILAIGILICICVTCYYCKIRGRISSE